jgi:ADP-heptose:LPS heptosyltransferase
MSEQIIIRRSHALGDVILVTPVVREMRRRYPQAEINVVTHYPAVFRHSPQQTEAYEWLDSRLADIFVNLDGAYERRPQMHIVEAYMEEAFGPEHDVRSSFYQPELFFPPNSLPIMQIPDNLVVIHPAVAGWANRTMPRRFWNEVIHQLRENDFAPLIVGLERDAVGIDAVWFSIPDIHVIAQLISRAICFVGSDSALLHVAGCTMTPIVGVFTATNPKLRLPYRFGTLGLGCAAVMPVLDCVYCLHRRPPPVTTEACERGNEEKNMCVEWVDPAWVVDAVLQMTRP